MKSFRTTCSFLILFALSVIASKQAFAADHCVLRAPKPGAHLRMVLSKTYHKKRAGHSTAYHQAKSMPTFAILPPKSGSDDDLSASNGEPLVKFSSLDSQTATLCRLHSMPWHTCQNLSLMTLKSAWLI